MKQVLLKRFQTFLITVMLMIPSVSQPAIANELLDNSSVAPDKSYTKVDFGFNNCNVQWGELLSEVSEPDMVKLANEANANGFTYHPSLNYGHLMVGYYPEGCKSPANESWPLYLKNVSDKKIVFAGVWLYEGKPGPVISVSGDNVTIDMSAYNRPEATGKIVSDNKISVTFKDHDTFTGELVDYDRIKWSNGGFWNRSQFAGVWLYEGKTGPVISVSGDNVTIDMSAYNRPEATGRIVSDNKISVTFKDDSTFTGELFDKKRIEWSNGTVWNR